jgi:hypothetical protein
LGTIYQRSAENNVALVKVADTGQVTAVKIDHVLKNEYKVIDIREKFIELVTRSSVRYIVYLDKFGSEFRDSSRGVPHNPNVNISATGTYKEEGFERKDGNVTMSSSYRDKIVNQDLTKILMQATAEPHMVNGAIQGFKLSQIDEDSVFRKGGLMDEDVVTAINGARLNNVVSAITLLKSLKSESSIDVDITRNGTPTSLKIRVQ